MIEVNAPEGPDAPAALAEGFPQGEEFDLLMAARNQIIDLFKPLGWIMTGASIGVGGADITFEAGARRIRINIEILE